MSDEAPWRGLMPGDGRRLAAFLGHAPARSALGADAPELLDWSSHLARRIDDLRWQAEDHADPEREARRLAEEGFASLWLQALVRHGGPPMGFLAGLAAARHAAAFAGSGRARFARALPALRTWFLDPTWPRGLLARRRVGELAGIPTLLVEGIMALAEVTRCEDPWVRVGYRSGPEQLARAIACFALAGGPPARDDCTILPRELLQAIARELLPLALGAEPEHPEEWVEPVDPAAVETIRAGLAAGSLSRRQVEIGALLGEEAHAVALGGSAPRMPSSANEWLAAVCAHHDEPARLALVALRTVLLESDDDEEDADADEDDDDDSGEGEAIGELLDAATSASLPLESILAGHTRVVGLDPGPLTIPRLVDRMLYTRDQQQRFEHELERELLAWVTG